nr:MAG TPA: hypothetical protein [Caudoviricetes sp.]
MFVTFESISTLERSSRRFFSSSISFSLVSTCLARIGSVVTYIHPFY